MRLYRHFACYIQKATVLNRGFYFIFPAPAAIVRSAVYYTLQYVGQFVEFVAVAAFYKYGTPAYVAGLYGVFHFRFILEGAELWRNAAEVFSHEPHFAETGLVEEIDYLAVLFDALLAEFVHLPEYYHLVIGVHSGKVFQRGHHACGVGVVSIDDKRVANGFH